jgi:signal transduction histidine kinase
LIFYWPIQHAAFCRSHFHPLAAFCPSHFQPLATLAAFCPSHFQPIAVFCRSHFQPLQKREQTTITMRLGDFVIAIAYFSIALQILVSLYRYQRLAWAPKDVLVLLVLFVLIFFLCGAGHLLRCMGWADTSTFQALNMMTGFITLATALYFPLQLPHLSASLDGLQDLVKLKEEAAESKRQLMTFMSFLCHELRNPLFAITSSISFLEDEHMSPEQEKGLSLISQSAALMSRLVNDVLDIRKLELGKLEIEDHVFDLHNMLEGIKRSSCADAQQRHLDSVSVRTSIARELPRTVCGGRSSVFGVIAPVLWRIVSLSNTFFLTNQILFASCRSQTTCCRMPSSSQKRDTSTCLYRFTTIT